jgi:hypothetical protein
MRGTYSTRRIAFILLIFVGVLSYAYGLIPRSKALDIVVFVLLSLTFVGTMVLAVRQILAKNRDEE